MERAPSPANSQQKYKSPQDFSPAGFDLYYAFDVTPRPFCRTLRLNDFAAANARGANADVLGRGSHLGVNRAQIYIPAPLAHIVGVADSVSKLGTLAADITNSCHNSVIPSKPVAETCCKR